MQTQEKLCLSCQKPVQGRADKKFCDDYCRNNYNNLLNSEINVFVKNVNNILKKNRKTLEELLPEGTEMTKTTRDRLLQKGYNFQYHTHNYTNKKGDTYTFCYEFGYLELDNNWFLIVKRKGE
jgi:transcriptional accessory protein Tex/SPT6